MPGYDIIKDGKTRDIFLVFDGLVE
jgi:CRP-like cAMP-binding protein